MPFLFTKLQNIMIQRILKKIKEFYNNEYGGKISIVISIEQIVFTVISLIFILWILTK